MREGQASGTAKLVAFYRAMADAGVTSIPGFRDPFARELLSGWAWRASLRVLTRRASLPDDPGMRAARGHLDGLMLRVAFLDALAAEHSAPQVVIVGAGLDTRAWRLTSLRGVRVFEVDHPATQAYKREGVARLPAPLAQVSFVPVDFTRDALEAALGSAGHNPSLPTLWIWEGVIMYLDDAALRGTLAALRRMSSSGSTLLAHYHEPDPKTDPTGSVVMRKLVLRWLGEPQIGMRSRDQMRSELERAGFAVLQDAGVVEQAERVGGSAPTIAVSRVSRVAVARG